MNTKRIIELAEETAKYQLEAWAESTEPGQTVEVMEALSAYDIMSDASHPPLEDADIPLFIAAYDHTIEDLRRIKETETK